MSKVHRGGYALIFTLLCALVVRLAFTARLGHDDIEHLHTAWLMWQGQQPYLDFFQKQSPLLWYLLQPVIALADGDLHIAVFLARGLMLVAYLATLGAVTMLARAVVRKGNYARVAPLLLLAAPVVSYNLLVVRPDGVMVPLVLWGLHFTAKGLARPRFLRFFVAGLFLGAASAVLLKAVPVALVLWAATGFVLWRQGRGVPTVAVSLGAMAVGGMVIAGAFVTLLLAVGLLEGFYFFNVTFNGVLYRQPWPGDVPWATRVTTVLGNEMRQEAWLLIGAAGALVFTAHWARRMRQQADGAAVVAGASLILAGTILILVNRLPFYSYFLLPLLGGAILGPAALAWLLGRFSGHRLAYQTPRAKRQLSMATLVAGVLLVWLVFSGIHWHNRFSTNEGQLDKLAALPRTEAVHDMPNHPVFAPDAHRIWDNVDRYQHTFGLLEDKGLLPGWVKERYLPVGVESE